MTKTGALFCWGDNSSGQLGVDVTGSRATPQQVGMDLGWEQVSTGMSHTCAIRSDKSMWCWGSNYFGELGIGAATEAGPVLVP